MSEGVTVVTGAVEGFDYGALDSETRIVVQQRTGEIRSLVRRSAQDVIDIGQKLADVKQRLEHGQFRNWLETEFGWSKNTANRFMQVAERFGEMSQIGTFAPSALYLLAAPSTPEEAVDEALERAAGGERITHAAARGIVETYRPEPARKPATIGRIEDIIFDYIRRQFVTNEKAYPFLANASSYTEAVLMQSIHARGDDCDEWTLRKAINAVAQRIAPTETDEERRQRIRENDRRMKDEINGRYAAAGPALPPVELMPIEDWELDEFVERVAGEAFGADRLGKEVVWNSMVIGAKGQSGEFWSRLRRALAPFDVTDEQVQEAVYEFVRKAKGNNGQRSTGNGQLSTAVTSAAPSAEAWRFGQEVKAATWGGVQRDDRPMVTAEGLANSLRGWAAQKAPGTLEMAAEYRGGAVWFEARQIVSGLNYRDKELIAALEVLASEGREENGRRSMVNGQWSMGEGEPAPVVFVDDDELRKLAEASYSGDTLTGYGKTPYMRGMFEYDGRRWVAVVGNGTSVRVHELDEEIAPGETVSGMKKDAYLGREAIYRGKMYRLGAQWLVVTRSHNPLLSDGGEEDSHEDAKALRGHEEDAKPMYVPEFSKPLDRADELAMFAAKFRGLLGMNEFADGSLRRWGDLTGRHSETGEAERGLRRLMAITEREMALLRGELAPEAEGWGV